MEARDISQERSPPFQISLRVRHPSIDPETISRELRMEAEYSFKAGEPRESGSGNAVTAVHAESYWLGSLSSVTAGASLSGFGSRRLQTSSAESLTLALDALVVGFMRIHAEFIRRMQNEEGQVSLLIELSTRALNGFTLSPQFSRTCSDLGVALEFDFVTS